VTDGETSPTVIRIAEMLGAGEGVAASESFVSALGWAILDSMNLSFDDVENEIVERRGPEILRSVLQAHGIHPVQPCCLTAPAGRFSLPAETSAAEYPSGVAISNGRRLAGTH